MVSVLCAAGLLLLSGESPARELAGERDRGHESAQLAHAFRQLPGRSLFGEEQGLPGVARAESPLASPVEEGAEGAEGGHRGHGEEGEEHHVSETTRVVACFLIGCLIFNMMILELVHYNDANVRSDMYIMISATMSIFAAVLINQAVECFIVEQLFEGQPPRGLGIEVTKPMRVLIGAFCFLCAFALLNVLCCVLRHHHNYMEAVEDIGGHVTAFAGISFFGQWQEMNLKDMGIHPSLLMPPAALIFVLCCAFASWIRRQFSVEAIRKGSDLQRATSTGSLSPEAEERHEEELHQQQQELEESLHVERRWLHSVEKAETEAAAILLSFLMHQSMTYHITGKISHFKGETKVSDHDLGQIRHLTLSSLVFLVVLVTSVFWNQHKEKRRRGGSVSSLKPTNSSLGDHAGDALKRFSDFWEAFLAMTMSWAAMRVAYWLMRMAFVDVHTSQAAAALAVTFLCVILVIVLDFLADRINSRKEERRRRTRHEAATEVAEHVMVRTRSKEHASPPQAPHRAVRIQEHEDHQSDSSSEESSSASAAEEGGVSRMYGSVSGVSSYLMQALKSDDLLGGEDSWLQDDNAIEKALRAIIVGFSLLVGLCWEKAFDSAEEAVVEGFGITAAHKVITKILVATITAIAVIPAWLRFMVPMAKMHWREHKAIMDMEALTASTSPAALANMTMLIEAAKKLSPEQLASAVSMTMSDRPDGRRRKSFSKEFFQNLKQEADFERMECKME